MSLFLNTSIFFILTLCSQFFPVFAKERVAGNAGSSLIVTSITDFVFPWAMCFLDEDTLIVTTKPGELWLVGGDGKKQLVDGLPKVAVGGQGGLGDVVPHPDYSKNGILYLSYVEKATTSEKTGAVVIRAKLEKTVAPKLINLQKVWVQLPKLNGKGHYSHRIAFGPEGSTEDGKIFITSGDRQYQNPAQSWDMALGKIIRLNEDGSVPNDNPFKDKGELAKTYWSLGHRNSLGLAFNKDGKLWSHEMGPQDGDELNLIQRGKNYGWPIVSEGSHYDGRAIPQHVTQPKFTAPKLAWIPTIAPSGLIIYSGKLFPDWVGNAFIGGLRSRALIRVEIDKTSIKEVERFSWGARIREIEEAPDGALWVLEDGPRGRLMRLSKDKR